MSSSDSNPVPDDAWARHYRTAAQRRRERGWHRRDEPAPRRDSRLRTYVVAAAIFVALTIVALVLPR